MTERLKEEGRGWIRMTGTGDHMTSTVLDGETGEDLSRKYGIVAVRPQIIQRPRCATRGQPLIARRASAIRSPMPMGRSCQSGNRGSNDNLCLNSAHSVLRLALCEATSKSSRVMELPSSRVTSEPADTFSRSTRRSAGPNATASPQSTSPTSSILASRLTRNFAQAFVRGSAQSEPRPQRGTPPDAAPPPILLDRGLNYADPPRGKGALSERLEGDQP